MNEAAVEEVMSVIGDIFKDVFDDPGLQISSETSASDIEEWDSLNNIHLVIAMEKIFGIKFVLAELEELRNVGDMANLL